MASNITKIRKIEPKRQTQVRILLGKMHDGYSGGTGEMTMDQFKTFLKELSRNKDALPDEKK